MDYISFPTLKNYQILLFVPIKKTRVAYLHIPTRELLRQNQRYQSIRNSLQVASILKELRECQMSAWRRRGQNYQVLQIHLSQWVMLNLFNTTSNRHPYCVVKYMGVYGERCLWKHSPFIFCGTYLINLNKLNNFC